MADRTTRSGGMTDAGMDTSPADWTVEERWWRDNYRSRPYARSDRDFDFYRGAYRYGYEGAARGSGNSWNDVESDMKKGWDRYEGRGDSMWDDVKDAVRDAWDRVRGRR